MNIIILAVLVTTGVFVCLSLILLLAEHYLANYGICRVTINHGDAEFEQPGGSTLLNALITNKIFIPSACGGKGSCGYCKVRVTKGGSLLLPTELPYLTRSEQRRGVRLACQVKIKENIELEISGELLKVKEYRARVTESPLLTADIREINLDLVEPERIEQNPGQYVQVQAPGPDGAVFRAYSISSPAHEDRKVQLIVRLVPDGIASTYLHQLKEGDEVNFTGPYGEFRLSEDPDTEIVCVGGGCGMAPMTNIIFTCYARWPERKLYLFFGCRSTRDVFYLDRFKALAQVHPNLKLFYALSDPLGPDEKWEGESGFVHYSVDKHLEPDVKRQAFLCGPPPMIEAVITVLKKKGLTDEDIFYDKF